jgi:MFS family permease
VFIEPISAEFGWSLGTVSFAVTVNFLLYGLVAPFGAALMEAFGVRRVVAGALVLLALGMALITVISQPWQLILFWGVFLGVGAGCLALVLGSIVATR